MQILGRKHLIPATQALGVFQHISYQDAITARWVAEQHMGYRTHQLPILNDGTSGHALYNAAGSGKQFGIRDGQQEVARIGIAVENFVISISYSLT